MFWDWYSWFVGKFSVVLSEIKALRMEIKMASAAVEKIRTEVEELKTVNQSVITLLSTLSQQIRDLKDDPVALEQLATDLDSQTNALADAVVANTPDTPSA